MAINRIHQDIFGLQGIFMVWRRQILMSNPNRRGIENQKFALSTMVIYIANNDMGKPPAAVTPRQVALVWIPHSEGIDFVSPMLLMGKLAKWAGLMPWFFTPLCRNVCGIFFMLAHLSAQGRFQRNDING